MKPKDQGGEGYIPKQAMGDLHACLSDSQKMYDFLQNIICRKVEDITIMCDLQDFGRIAQKPTYTGDFYPQLFEWNYTKITGKHEMGLVKQKLKDNYDPSTTESWNDFQTSLNKIKWDVRPATHEWMKTKVKKDIEFYKGENASMEAKKRNPF